MPIYGYRCTECAHEFEVLQSMRDDPLTTCPECSGKLVKKLYPVGVMFKGSGFHNTDYKAGGNREPKPAAADSPSETKGSTDAAPTPAKADSAGSGSSSGSESAPKAEKKSEPKPAPKASGTD